MLGSFAQWIRAGEAGTRHWTVPWGLVGMGHRRSDPEYLVLELTITTGMKHPLNRSLGLLLCSVPVCYSCSTLLSHDLCTLKSMASLKELFQDVVALSGASKSAYLPACWVVLSKFPCSLDLSHTSSPSSCHSPVTSSNALPFSSQFHPSCWSCWQRSPTPPGSGLSSLHFATPSVLPEHSSQPCLGGGSESLERQDRVEWASVMWWMRADCLTQMRQAVSVCVSGRNLTNYLAPSTVTCYNVAAKFKPSLSAEGAASDWSSPWLESGEFKESKM